MPWMHWRGWESIARDAPRRSARRVRATGSRAWGPRARLIALRVTGGLPTPGRSRVIVADSRRAACSRSAKLLQLGQILLGASYCTKLDHRFALNGDCITVVGFEQESLLRKSDRLAEQFLPLSHTRQRIVGRALRGSTASAVSSVSSASTNRPAARCALPCFKSSTERGASCHPAVGRLRKS